MLRHMRNIEMFLTVSAMRPGVALTAQAAAA